MCLSGDNKEVMISTLDSHLSMYFYIKSIEKFVNFIQQSANFLNNNTYLCSTFLLLKYYCKQIFKSNINKIANTLTILNL